MPETFFDTCVNWSCVTRCGYRTTSSTFFYSALWIQRVAKKDIANAEYVLPIIKFNDGWLCTIDPQLGWHLHYYTHSTVKCVRTPIKPIIQYPTPFSISQLRDTTSLAKYTDVRELFLERLAFPLSISLFEKKNLLVIFSCLFFFPFLGFNPPHFPTPSRIYPPLHHSPPFLPVPASCPPLTFWIPSPI